MSEAPGGAATEVALLLTPIPRPRFLVALCALQKVHGRVLETSGGPVAVLDDASFESAQKAARAVSGFVKGAEFILAMGREGTVRVQLWQGGAMEQELPAGLALADAPGVVTTLLTGAQTLDQVAETHQDKVHSTRVGRVAAYRELLREAKALKKEQRA